MEILQVKNLKFTYPHAPSEALSGISFSLQKGNFTLLTGESGCGKTTLLRLIKNEIAPFGEKSGEILFLGNPHTQAAFNRIGYVGRNPDEQIVTDKVWHELAFGAENMGLSREEIRLRVGETASYFGIQNWYHQPTDQLSGGQKQLLNLASVMVMQPDLLLLDEPTGQVDPITAATLIATLKKMNRELGITVLITEHRLEEVFPLADSVMVMRKGKLVAADTPKAVCEQLRGDELFTGFPTAARLWSGLGGTQSCPLTVREGRRFFEERFGAVTKPFPALPEPDGKPCIEAKNVWFRYERHANDVIRDMSFCVRQGEIFSILGGNGSGKTTTLNLLAGLLRPTAGNFFIFGKKVRDYHNGSLYRQTLAMLPQNPKILFLRNTVKEDLEEYQSLLGIAKEEQKQTLKETVDFFEIAPFLNRHPYDLSGGEQQKCALAKLMLAKPEILLLDEPTKGLDATFKNRLSVLLKQLQRNGKTVIMVTHDVEFAAAVSTRCGLFFDGTLLSVSTPHVFFLHNRFYTTAASRIAREHFPGAVTCEEVIRLCKPESEA